MNPKHIQSQFWAIPKEIMAVTSLSLEARMIYAILFTRSNGENVSWPSQKSLAETIGCGVRSIQRHLDELKNMALIEVIQSGKKRTNRYVLTRQIVVSPSERYDTAVVSPHDTAVVSSVKEHLKKNNSLKKESTPAKISDFFENPSSRESVIQALVARGASEPAVRAEILKFISYWTEPNRSGTKQRWEAEKFFDIRRRLATWFSRANTFKGREDRQMGMVL